MTPDIRRLHDEILIDGEQDAAPSLDDMAKRAKAILDAEATAAASRRKNHHR